MDARVSLILNLARTEDAKLVLPLACEQLGLSESHLRRLIRQELGVPFRSFMRSIKMHKASEMLEKQNTAIKRIARDLGYSDLSNFYHDFKQACGVTPREFRLQRLKESLQANHHESN